MDLNLFENLKRDKEPNVNVKNFMKELNNFLQNISSKTQDKKNNVTNEKEVELDINGKSQENETTLEENKKMQEHRKEGHLYLVTEDRNNEIYLWDFTDKAKSEFKETTLSNELLSVAKEGAMLQYKNGKYELYSPYGYDLVYNEENKDKSEK